MTTEARKRFGQHFLEPAWTAKVIRAIDPQPSDTFLEIGPGRGALTRPLAQIAHVTAVEIDRDLGRHLAAEPLPRLSLIVADFLKLTLEDVRSALPPEPATVRVAGNLPYNVASRILSRLAELYRDSLPLLDATVMVQREVADRLRAQPGSRDYGVLTIRVAYRADVQHLLDLPPGAFRPAPRVHSSVVRLRFRPPSRPARDEGVFSAVTEAIFTRRRKTLANALLALEQRAPGSLPGRAAIAEVLGQTGLEPRQRPETLTLDDLVRLADAVAARKGAVLY